MDDKVPPVISHYLVESLLGVGGMGAVYSGVDQRDGSPVAIKLLHRHLSDDPAFRERFEQEAHLAALLRSPYTVHLVDFGVAEGRCFMVMEYIDGETLGQLLREGPLPSGRALRIAAQVARALEEAHARGVVHRDIKPENVLLLGESAKVADFGIARRADAATQTLPGGFYGTISYAAPEQLTGEADHRTDIYALGATLFHMLAGRPPFIGSTEDVLRQIAKDPAPLEQLEGQPQDVAAIVSRCLEKAPEARYASASELAAELERTARRLSTSPLPAPSASPATTTVVAEREPAPQPLSMRLTSLAPRSRVAARLRPSRFDLELRNDGDEPVEVELHAEDRGGGCRFALPAKLSLAGRATARARVRVWPKKRRWRGKPITRIFTVFGSGGSGPPVSASARFDDLPYGWVPYGGALAAGAAAALLTGGAFAAGLVGPEPGPEPLRIGLLMPFSGNDPNGQPYAEYGTAYLNAAAMAVEEINSDGGVLGQPIVLVRGDSTGNHEVGVPEAQRLLDEERVQAIIGDLNDLTSLMIADGVTNPRGIVQVTPGELGTDDQSAEAAADFPFLFLSTPPLSLEGFVLAQLVKETGTQKACIVSDAPPSPAAGLADAFRRSVADLELVEVAITPLMSAEDSSAKVGECAGAGAIMVNVYPIGLPPEEGERSPENPGVYTSPPLKEALAEGMEPVFVSSVVREEEPGSSASVFDDVGWDRAASVGGTAVIDARVEQGEAFDRDFEARLFGDPEGVPHLRQVYDAVYLIALAAEKAGTTDPQAIRAAMHEIANAPGTVVNPGSSKGRLVGGAVQGGGFQQVKDLIARGEDIDYEGAAGPIEFDDSGRNVRGAVEIWKVDAATQTFVTERLLIVDRTKGTTTPAE